MIKSTEQQTTIKYCVGSSADDYWRATNARTLTGAKAIASRLYRQHGTLNKIEVAVVHGFGAADTHYHPVAVKYAYGRWQAV